LTSTRSPGGSPYSSGWCSAWRSSWCCRCTSSSPSRRTSRRPRTTSTSSSGRSRRADLPRLEEDIRNYELDLDRLRRILPTKRETDDLIKRLKHLTERGNFQLTRFVPGNIMEREFYLERPITVELDGTYHELGLFFDRLSGFSRIINVNDLVITPVRGQGGAGYSIHAAFTQRTFIYKE
jgi:type IV pilus assembly protein PilO